MKFILSQLYDIRPLTKAGRLDLSRIYRSGGVVNLRDESAVIAEKQLRRGKTQRVRRIERQAPSPSVQAHVRVEQASRALPDFSHLQPDAVIAAAQHPVIVSQEPPSFISHDQNTPQLIESEDSQSRRLAVRSFIPQSGETAIFPQAFDEALDIPEERRLRGFAIAIFLVVVFIPVLAVAGSAASVQRSILAAAAEASGDIETAAAAIAALDPQRAESAFQDAQSSFREAQEHFSSLGYGALSLAAELPVPTRLATGKALLRAGEHFASAGEHLSRALRTTDVFSSGAVIGRLVDAKSETAGDTASVFEEEFAKASAQLLAAAEELDRVDPDAVPEAYREKVRRLRDAAPALRSSVELLASSSRAVSRILGMGETRRYLVLLQNASELRPSGGFIGNVAIIEVKGGAIRKMQVEDTYLFDGQLTRYTVPPKPIQDISTAWSLHDANWFRNFPDSARAASDFFEQTGSMTPHGVIAVTSRFVERVLSVTGPVTAPDGLTVDAQSFTDAINAIGERQRPGETIQVQALGALLPAILERLGAVPPESALDAVRVSIAAGDLQVWFRDEEEESLVRRLGMAGELPATDGDVLAVVSANINGFKTDRVLEEAIAHEARIASDGSVTDTVALTRTHRGDERREAAYRKVHKSYVRVFVPLGSELLSAEGMTCDLDSAPLDYASAGFSVHPLVASIEQTQRRHSSFCVDIGEESGKTTFGAWLFVSPGESLTYRLTYRVPVRLTGSVDSYRLAAIKQPGAEPVFSSRVVPDVAWEPSWNDEAYRGHPDGTFGTAPEPLLRNRLFGIVFTKP